MDVKRLTYTKDDTWEEVWTTYQEYLDKLTEKERQTKIENSRYNTFLVFHSGKVIMSGLTDKFMKDIYMDDKAFNNYVMFVDCAHGKGIKFVREDLKHFAKTNVSKNTRNQEQVSKRLPESPTC